MSFFISFQMFKTKSYFLLNLGRLHPLAKMYGEVFVNGVKTHMPYGSYVSFSYIFTNGENFICYC